MLSINILLALSVFPTSSFAPDQIKLHFTFSLDSSFYRPLKAIVCLCGKNIRGKASYPRAFPLWFCSDSDVSIHKLQVAATLFAEHSAGAVCNIGDHDAS